MKVDLAARTSPLLEPLTLREVTARNRVMVSPMCQYCAPEATPGDWHFVHLGSRAVGGAGIVMTEDTAVEPAGRITRYDLGLWNDEQEAAFVRIARFVGEQGAVPGIQLGHAGRKASHGRPWDDRRPLLPHEGGWEVVGPSTLPWEPGDLVPRALTTDEIAGIVERFHAAARRALRAGFRVLELHFAHGYLAHAFMSPLSNQREDLYGGELANRVRFALEVVDAVRDAWPAELPLFVRLSATDWVPGGWTLEETIRLARLLAARDVDLIDCSSGGSSPQQEVPTQPGYQVPFAEAVRREADVATGAVGLLFDYEAAERLIADGSADLVVLGRIMLWDPYWPHHAAAALGVPLHLPEQYARSAIHRRFLSRL